MQEEAAAQEGLARRAMQQSLGSGEERQQAAAAAAVLHPDASGAASLGHRPTSGDSLASRQAQAKGQQQEQQQLAAHRPACINSARGAEYFNQAPSSSGGSHSAGSGGGGANNGSGQQHSGGSGGGGGSVPAHNRLYADHFRKQQRLEEERRLRWVLAGWAVGCWDLQPWGPASSWEACRVAASGRRRLPSAYTWGTCICFACRMRC